MSICYLESNENEIMLIVLLSSLKSYFLKTNTYI